MNRQHARELCDAIRADVEDVRARLVELYAGEAWKALGHKSWGDMCAAEFGARVSALLSSDERRELVEALSGEGMSTRAVGAALGVGKSTVERDRSRGPDGTPDADVIGLDGKRYRPKGKAKPRDSLTTEARRVCADLDKAVLRLQRLAADDRFEPGRRRLAEHMREPLTNAAEVCTHVIHQLGD